MNTQEAKSLYERAFYYVSQEHPEELSWAQSVTPKTFEELDPETFLSEYCWVVDLFGNP